MANLQKEGRGKAGNRSSRTELCSNCNIRERFGEYPFCGKACAEEYRKKQEEENGGSWGLTSVMTAFGNIIPTVEWDLDPPASRPNRGSAPAALAARTSIDRDRTSETSSNARFGSKTPDDAGPAPRFAQSAEGNKMCENCHVREKYQEKDPIKNAVTIFPFCGKSCRDAYVSKNQQFSVCKLKECNINCRGLFCSEKHAKRAVLKREVKGCAYCKEMPAAPPYEFCSKECGAKDASLREKPLKPLTLLQSSDDVSKAITGRFIERWRDPSGTLAPPQIFAIFQISLPQKYERRFQDAIRAGDPLGGSTTRSTFYGGQCICDIGIQGKPELCNWPSCSICLAVRTGFEKLEFGTTEHNGVYGKGIYTNTNPFHAHQFTVRKSTNPYRAMILCSVIEPDKYAKRDPKVPAGFIDETGRAYCASKSTIIPRQLIVYNEPPNLRR